MADETLYDRALAWAGRRRLRIGRRNPWEVAVCLGREAVEDRVSGLAAEMAFFALLSLVPMMVAVGAALGYLERLLGVEQVLQAQSAVIRALAVVFNPRLTGEVIAPSIRALLSQERGGLALTSLLLTLYLASRVFTATIRSLDLAYDVTERRGIVAQRLLAVAFAVGFVLVVVLTLALMVVGPLLGSGSALAARFGFGRLFEVAWQVGRWPVLVTIAVGFFAVVYRFGPNLDHGWRDSLPGAVLGVVLWVLATLLFRVYLAAGGAEAGTFVAEDEAIALVGRAIGALVATIIWTYLTGLAILVGGELNAILSRP